jgi:competence protein ComEC
MPLLWLSLAFLAGVLLAPIFAQPLAAWLVLAGIISFLLIVGWWARRVPHFPARKIFSGLLTQPNFLPLPPLLFFLLIVIGGLRYQSALPNSGTGSVAALAAQSQNLSLQGVVIDSPVLRDQSVQVIVNVDRIRLPGATDDHETQGKIQATLPTGTDWQYGDRLRLQGELQPLDFEIDPSYSQYLQNQGIVATMPYALATRLASNQASPILGWIFQLRDRARTVLYQLYPDPEASLIVGILLGDESGIPSDVSEAFRNTGTTHIIAISGFNISILVAVLWTFWGHLLGNRRRVFAALLSITGIIFYTFLVGASASVVRSALMGSLALLGKQFGRRQNGVLMLVLVAACMAFWDPLVLGDIGFQLSFSATLGLILYADPLAQSFHNWLTRFLHGPIWEKLASLVSEYFLMTLAAQALSWPVLAYHFGEFSLASFPTNVFILPAQPLAMIAGGISAIFGLIYLPLGRLAALPTWPCLAYTIRMVELFARLPIARLSLAWFGLSLALLYYALLLAWTFARNRLKSQLAAWGPAVPFAALVLLAAWAWHSALHSPDGRLHLTLLDVSTSSLSGEAVLIQTPTGRYLLVGGGPNVRSLSDSFGRWLPMSEKLDWWVIANPDQAHISALPRLLERYPPENVLWSGSDQATSAARTLQATFAQNRVPVTQAQAGQELDLGAGAKLKVAANGEQGSLMLLEWKNFRALLPIGLDNALIKTLADDHLSSQVNLLLLAKNGCKDLNPPGWIAALHPQLALISVAPGDRSGHPDPETLQALDGYSVLRTDQNGWIHVTTDGEQMWVEVEKR